MPFTTGEARHITDSVGPQEMGDYCFLHYREMLRAWRKSPRWTTAHELYRDMVMAPRVDNPVILDVAHIDQHLNNKAARELAWQVFFQLHVMPYEMQKRTLNGEVDY